MIGCIIQARMGSTRLPGKVLKNIEKNKTVLYFVINQLQDCKLIDKIVVATTNLEEDKKLCLKNHEPTIYDSIYLDNSHL